MSRLQPVSEAAAGHSGGDYFLPDEVYEYNDGEEDVDLEDGEEDVELEDKELDQLEDLVLEEGALLNNLEREVHALERDRAGNKIGGHHINKHRLHPVENEAVFSQ